MGNLTIGPRYWLDLLWYSSGCGGGCVVYGSSGGNGVVVDVWWWM